MSAAILYLHGFRSSPASWKVRLLGEHMASQGLGQRFACPALSHVPSLAVAQAEALIAAADGPLTLVGSSLGGFYATWLAEKYDLQAVLINPAVLAPLSLAEHLGTQTNLHTGETFEFTSGHIAELRALEVAQITPARYLLLVETGDEVLDCRHALARYAGCRQIVCDGGDHSFTRFPDFLPQILEFGGL
ncbi:MAG: YqiA/YcfP family alpha/beta fold hydrolase [Rhodocyclaceae bacterium]